MTTAGATPCEERARPAVCPLVDGAESAVQLQAVQPLGERLLRIGPAPGPRYTSWLPSQSPEGR